VIHLSFLGKAFISISIIALCLILLVGCATQPPPIADDPPGFFSGIFHALLLPLAFPGSIFLDIRIYSFPNSGFFYDLGYVIGLVIHVGWVVAAYTEQTTKDDEAT